jgi:hypothetical protein
MLVDVTWSFSTHPTYFQQPTEEVLFPANFLLEPGLDYRYVSVSYFCIFGFFFEL